MTQAVNSNGTLLQMGDGMVSETFTTVAEVLDISGPSLEAGTEEATSHDSDGWREFIVTLLTAGEVSFDLNFFNDPTQDFTTGILDVMLNGETVNWQLVFPTSPLVTVSFAAMVTGHDFDAPVEGKLSASVTLQTTGEVDFT